MKQKREKIILTRIMFVLMVTAIILTAINFAVVKNEIQELNAAVIEIEAKQIALEEQQTEISYIEDTSIEEPEEVELPEYYNLGEFKLTAYCACAKCCGKSDGITATGTHAKAGRTIAVDPDVIPYGSEVVIEFKNGTSHTYIAEDCGGAISDNRIDIYFDSHEEALKFGVQKADVKVKVCEE